MTTFNLTEDQMKIARDLVVNMQHNTPSDWRDLQELVGSEAIQPIWTNEGVKYRISTMLKIHLRLL